MVYKSILVCAAIFAFLGAQTVKATAADSPWSATLYAGPATNRWVTQVLATDFVTNGAMIGLAVDRRIISLGSGISFGAEAQWSQFSFGVDYGAASLGIGLRFDDISLIKHLPMTFAVYSGPSYATNSPRILPYGGYMPRFVNYVGAELGITIPKTRWDIVFRVFHRSGAWGLYSTSADEGSMFGLGLRRRF